MDHLEQSAANVIDLRMLRVGICPGWPISAKTRLGISDRASRGCWSWAPPRCGATGRAKQTNPRRPTRLHPPRDHPHPQLRDTPREAWQMISIENTGRTAEKRNASRRLNSDPARRPRPYDDAVLCFSPSMEFIGLPLPRDITTALQPRPVRFRPRTPVAPGPTLSGSQRPARRAL